MPKGKYIRTQKGNDNMSKSRILKGTAKGKNNPMYGLTGNKCPHYIPENHVIETRLCKCSDHEPFECEHESKQEYILNHHSKNKPSWCTGLTKENDSRVKKFAEGVSGENSHLFGMNGDKNNNWKGGITTITHQVRTCFEYRQWRSDVFTRDDFTCQECGDNKGGNLNAHHIKPFSQIIEKHNIKTLQQARECEELWNINNGTTMCKKCHGHLKRK